ncbi:MAG: O-acetyl-ADP-ribose deacetylase [Oscillospiraceae bacterium]|nr:O-acetyl-ADP-ribose deacetylase [Oscillospiraceae bacterium]
MPFQIVRNDITRMNVDAIVNAANSSLLGGGGVDGAIHRAAGPGLLEECRTLRGCPPGHAKITGGYDLPAKYVIHTVGPIWQGGGSGEAELLADCYRNALSLAAEYGLESVAFPLISAGAYGYPKAEALEIAVRSMETFLRDHEMEIYLVVFDKASFRLSRERMQDIREYIDQRYVDEHPADRSNRNIWSEMRFGGVPSAAHAPQAPQAPQAHQEPQTASGRKSSKKSGFSLPFGGRKEKREEDEICDSALPENADLEALLSQVDESFSQMLLRKIDESGMTDAQCYKKANIDRKLFSKIRGDVNYRPSKPTAIAFAIALELSLPETRDLLSKAGFALSHSSKFDIIIEYFIQRRNFNIFEINEALFAFDQSLLGAG